MTAALRATGHIAPKVNTSAPARPDIGGMLNCFFVRKPVSLAILTGSVAALLLAAPLASAQTTVSLPDTSQTTILTATVAEQARVSFPSTASFSVNDVASTTASTAASITLTNIVLSSATRQLRVSLQADAASFTPPVAGAVTWAASDVTWNASTWSSGAGSTGTLSSASANVVATCSADAAACSTSGLVFTLGANTNVKRSGNHVLVVRWKLESV